MIIKKLVSLFFVFSLFMGGLVFLSTEIAFAVTCCGCGTYPGCQNSTKCICPGFHEDCPWCAVPDSGLEAVKASLPTKGKSGAVILSGIPASVLSSATEGMIIDIRRSSGQKNLMRKLVELESIKYARKFSCPQTEHTNLQSERLGLQAKVDLLN